MCIATELVHSAALQLSREDGFDELLDPALVLDRGDFRNLRATPLFWRHFFFCRKSRRGGPDASDRLIEFWHQSSFRPRKAVCDSLQS